MLGSMRVLCNHKSTRRENKCFHCTLLAAPNSLVLVSVQHSTSLSSVPFLAAENADLDPFGAVTGVSWLLGLNLEAAAAYENFPGNGACFCTAASFGIETAVSQAGSVAEDTLLTRGGFIFFVLLHIQERVLLWETYAPS